jgi:hypothetical protein
MMRLPVYAPFGMARRQWLGSHAPIRNFNVIFYSPLPKHSCCTRGITLPYGWFRLLVFALRSHAEDGPARDLHPRARHQRQDATTARARPTEGI